MAGEIDEPRPGLIPLADFVAALRAELEAARAQGARERLNFDVGPIELELELVTEKEASVRGGLRFWIVEAGAGGKWQRASRQRVKLTLTPVGTLKIRDETGPANTD